MAKKRGRKVGNKTELAGKAKNAGPKEAKSETISKGAIGLEKNFFEKMQDCAFLFLEIFKRSAKPKTEYRKKEAEDLRRVGWGVSDVVVETEMQKLTKKEIPTWFYIASIFTAFLFTVYISIYATIHFESIEYMNITIVFLFITMVSYFLISAIYFFSEKKRWHSVTSALFFAGVVLIMVYAFRAVDTSNLVRFSIVYTILVAAISTYILAIKR